MDIRLCKECGFILGTRPHLREEGGVCLACLNKDKKNISIGKNGRNGSLDT